MIQEITRILVYMVTFCVCFYALEGLDFAKIIRRYDVARARLLLVLFSAGLAYVVAGFILALVYGL